jgi:hypothetical protein
MQPRTPQSPQHALLTWPLLGTSQHHCHTRDTHSLHSTCTHEHMLVCTASADPAGASPAPADLHHQQNHHSTSVAAAPCSHPSSSYKLPKAAAKHRVATALQRPVVHLTSPHSQLAT